MTPPRRSALERLFRPESVAIIGASSDPGKTAGRPLRFLQLHGFTGHVWPVNPRYEAIGELPCFASIDALPQAPDVAIVLVGPAHAEQYLRDLARVGTGAAIAIGGGYGEVGGDGIRRQEALREAAGGMRLLGPNTIGLVNLVDHVTLSASGALDVEDRHAGAIAVVSQSGGILGSILSRAAYKGVGLSHLVATGNEADLEICDFVEFLIEDPATSVIALYLEALRQPDRFRRIALLARERGKPLVVYKVGRSEPGARSAASHTGALAGEDRLYDALFRQAGVIRVQNYGDLIDVPMALTCRTNLEGKRLGILTSTGGAGGLVADVCGMAGFDAPEPGADTAKALGSLLSHDGFAPDRNPIDLTLAGLQPETIHGAITALMDSEDYDGVISIVGSSGVGRPDLVATPVIEVSRTATKPLIVYSSPSAPDIIRRLNQAGVPAYDTPESCAAALEAIFQASRQAPTGDLPVSKRSGTLPALDHWAGRLNEAECKQLFAACGISCVREAIAPTPEEAGRAAGSLGPRLVVKILSRDLIHKSDVGGVHIDVATADVTRVCDEISASTRDHISGEAEGFLVQEYVTGGIEMLLGFVRDPQLGPAVMLGAGGTAAELYDDTAIRLLPLGSTDVAEMLDELTITTRLKGFRGAPAGDMEALIHAVMSFAHMCEAFGPRLAEAEINPLFVLPDGKGVKAADGVLLLSSSDRQSG
ncbi:MAG: acetate--CoA ligase family protein [Rhodospirillaceae bacterium]|nr:acetate--CoA ligase family protein [Rhodospirillaceae bacterium]MBT5456723.1 acetate--CoA ligase family protein [Rhodospirillaceae bacterium]